MLLDGAWRIARPLAFRLDAERAHEAVLRRLAHPAAPRLLRALAVPPTPPVELAGLTLAGPVGLAAGMDKDGVAIPAWEAMGFGFVEVGTVTPRPQPGNPRPRLFRLVAERSLVNRMGFNNAGAEALARTLAELRARRPPTVPVGANIGRNKTTPNAEAPADYARAATALREVVDWITVNVSSPNTPGLRDLQAGDGLARILDAVLPAAGDRPVFVKLSPDLPPAALEAAVERAIGGGAAAIVATNTTRRRPGTTDRLGEAGGLSGSALWPLARERIGRVLAAADGRVPVIGTGGVDSPERARALLDLGCRAVQLLTGLVYEGPGLVSRINRDLAGRTPR